MRYPAPDPQRSPAELLEAVIAAYLEAADARDAPPREELLARYPELAADLTEFFAGHQAIDRLAGAVKAEGPLRSPLAGRPAIGEHDLLAEIGRGGMGVVYQARDRKLGRTVALKAILAGALASAEERQRFLREARAVAAFDHPHIVPIHEVGEEDGVPYFTMKLVEGGSLAAWDPLGGRTPLRCAEVISKVARAVHHAHERGILHRDLKPANVLLDGGGEPYVADFGLARPLELDRA